MWRYLLPQSPVDLVLYLKREFDSLAQQPVVIVYPYRQPTLEVQGGNEVEP